MNAPQENKLSMYLTVKAVCAPAPIQTIWSPLTAFADNYAAFLLKIGLIQQLAAAQTADRTGASRDKAGIMESLADALMAVAGALTAYATVGNDQTLAAKVDFSRSTFLRLRDSEISGTAKMIHTEATGRLAALAPYGVTAPMLDGLQDEIDTYEIIVEAPRASVVGRKTVTTQIAEEFRKTDLLLENVLDRLMQQFKTTQPGFYRDYFNARIIIDRPGGLGREEQPPQPPTP